MAFANPISLSGRESIVSYDFFDIIAGTGVQTFYGGKTMMLSGSLMISGMILSDKPFYSMDRTTKMTITSGSGLPENGIDANFDLLFNIPRIINGNVFIQIPQGINSLSNLNSGKKIYLDIYLRRVSAAGVETLLVSGSTLQHTFNPAAPDADEAYSRIETISLNLANQVFKQNEKFRLNVKQFVTRGTASNIQAGIGHDPMNQADNNNTETITAGTSGPIIQSTNEGTPVNRFVTDTNMIIHIPFKLEVD